MEKHVDIAKEEEKPPDIANFDLLEKVLSVNIEHEYIGIGNVEYNGSQIHDKGKNVCYIELYAEIGPNLITSHKIKNDIEKIVKTKDIRIAFFKRMVARKKNSELHSLGQQGYEISKDSEALSKNFNCVEYEGENLIVHMNFSMERIDKSPIVGASLPNE